MGNLINNDDLNFVGLFNHRNNGADVNVRIHNNSNGNPSLNITIKKDIAEVAFEDAFVRKTGIMVALHKDRLYFKEDKGGFTLCHDGGNANGSRRSIKLTLNKANEKFKKCVGDYDLLFNEDRGLYYIELNNEEDVRI